MININTGFHVGAALPLDDRAYLTKAEMLLVDENIYPDYFLTVCADDGFLYMFDKSIEEPSAETGKFKLFAGDVDELLTKLTADVDTEGSILNLIRENAANATYKAHKVDVIDDESGEKTGELVVVDEKICDALDRLAKDLTYVGTVEELPEEPKIGDLVNVVPAADAEADAPKGWKFWDGENWQSLDDPTLTKRVAALEVLHDTKEVEDEDGNKSTEFKTVEEEIIEKAKDGIYKEATEAVGEEGDDDYVPATPEVTIAEAIEALEDAAAAERIEKLEEQVGKDKEVTAYGEAEDLVDIVNTLTADVDTEGSVLDVINKNAKDAIYKEAETVVNYTNEDGEVITEAEYEELDDKEGWTKNEVAGDAMTIEQGIDAAKKDSIVTMFPITEGIEDENVLKTYEFYQGLDDVTTPEAAKLIGKIDLPKDMVVTSGSVIELKKVKVENPEYVDEETTPDVPPMIDGEGITLDDEVITAEDVADEESAFYGYPTEAGTYIKLVIANQKLPVFINAKALIDTGSLGSTTEDVTANVEVGGVMVGDTIEEGTDIQELVERLLIKYYPPTVTLTATPSNKVVEIGESINVELTAKVEKKSLDVEKLTFSDGTEVTKDVAEGGSFAHEIADPITETTTFDVTVTDGKKDVKAEVTYTFVNPYYTGVVAADATDVDITTLDKKIEIKGKKKYTYTAANEYIVFAYPASYGALTSILDPSSFENLGSFDKTSVTVNEVAYNVYTSATPVTCDGFAYTFVI